MDWRDGAALAALGARMSGYHPRIIDDALVARVRALVRTHGRMTALAMAATLAEVGIEIHPETARRAMRRAGIRACRPRSKS